MKAAIYTRVSSDDQAEHGTSLGHQRERCEAFCEAKGWEVLEVFTDEGVSGAKDSRPALDRLMAAAQAGRIDAVVVFKTDRFSRSRAHLFTALDDLSALGVAFTSVTEPFDTSTTHGDAMVGMLGVFAQMERKMIRERCRSGVNERVRQGGWGGGPDAPYGYRVEGERGERRLVVDEREAALVREAVRLVVEEGLPTLQVALRLNALGLTPRHVPLWTSQNLRNVLKRGQWGGVWTFGKPRPDGRPHPSIAEPIQVAVEPILTPAQVDALEAHMKRTTLRRGPGDVHPLSGRILCPCGQPMTGVARGDRANRRYRCRRNRKDPRWSQCTWGTLLADPVDDAVWTQVLDLLGDPDRLMALAQERLGLLNSAKVVETDALADAEAAVTRTQQALARGATKCISLGLDDDTTAETLANLREQHRAALQHRAAVAAVTAETDAAKARMVTAQSLAQVARDRLVTADASMRQQVFAWLDVQVRVVAREGKTFTLEVTGSVAHDLLLAGVTQRLAPGALASGFA